MSDHGLIRTPALAFLAALALTACKPARPSPTPLGDDELAAYGQGCKVDGDCTLVDNGCCSCRTGYEPVAILASEVATFRSLFKCDGVPCPTSWSTACNGLSAGCESGRCMVRRAPPVPLQIEREK